MLCFVICKCERIAIWQVKSKKELLEEYDVEEIDHRDFQYRRRELCSCCGGKVLVSTTIQKKRLTEMGKHRRKQYLKLKYQDTTLREKIIEMILATHDLKKEDCSEEFYRKVNQTAIDIEYLT